MRCGAVRCGAGFGGFLSWVVSVSFLNLYYMRALRDTPTATRSRVLEQDS